MRITDPDYQIQWHLHGDSSVGHLNVVPVWDQGTSNIINLVGCKAIGILGQGVRIAIVDDGIQSTHPDLAENVKIESSWNFNGNKQSPDPTYMKGHGGVRKPF